MFSSSLQPPQGAAAAAIPPSADLQGQLTFLLECINSTSGSVGQMYGEGGAAVRETAIQAFLNAQTDLSLDNQTPCSEEATAAEIDLQVFSSDAPLSATAAPTRRKRGKGISICPEHHNEVFESKAAFKEHMKAHDGVFHCAQPGCKKRNYIFTSAEGLSLHVSRNHSAALVGKQSLHFGCGHCRQPSSLRKVVTLNHLKFEHLIESVKLTITTPGQVEQHCLPEKDPSSSIRTFFLAPEFLKEQSLQDAEPDLPLDIYAPLSSMEAVVSLIDMESAEPDSAPPAAAAHPVAPGPVRRKRGKTLTVCPEHPQLDLKKKGAFKEHIQSHNNIFHCSQEGCGSSDHVFKTLKHLHMHVSNCHGAGVVGKESVRYGCGHCEKPSLLRKQDMLDHLKVHHLLPSKKAEIATLGDVERCCLPAEDPLNSMRTFTLLPEFLKRKEPSS